MDSKPYRTIILSLVSVAVISLILVHGNRIKQAEVPKPSISEGYSLTHQNIKEQSSPRDPKKYTIQVAYPVLSNSNRADAFNEDVRSLIEGQITDFKSSLNEENISLMPSEIQNATSTFIIDYSIENQSDNIISVLFEIENYLIGSAHPWHLLASVNFDLANGKVLSLADIFKPNSDYLSVISKYCFDDLTKQIRAGTYVSTEEYLQDSSALTPEAKNFTFFSITKQGLDIHFQEYEVGPYVAGPGEVLIRWGAIQNILSQQIL